MISANKPDDAVRAEALAAFERRAADSLSLLEHALHRLPHDGALLVAEASARAEAGMESPFQRLEGILRLDPSWVAGHRALAQLKIEFGFAEPLGVIESALAQRGNDALLWHCYLSLLSAQDRNLDAADSIAQLRRRVGEVPGLKLLEARYAGLAGDAGRGAALLRDLPEGTPDLAYQRARNALQRGDAQECARVLETAPMQGDMRVWAMAEIAWRALGDVRHPWLVQGDTLLAAIDLEIEAGALGELVAFLRTVHSSKAAPPSQSLRGGTQTRGNLHTREDPKLADLFGRMQDALVSYAVKLSALDPDHPLAVLGARAPQIASSWSVRLTEGGFHVPHMHDNGLISSACHLVVPEEASDGEGILELGRPPRDIALELGAVARFVPQPGHIILFPSFLYHSTTPFAAAERMSVVIDAA